MAVRVQVSSVSARRRTVLVKHDSLLSRREKLARDEMRVEPIEGEQFSVSPLLYNVAVVENDDSVGITNRGKPVRNHERRPTLHQAGQRLVDLRFVYSVQKRG